MEKVQIVEALQKNHEKFIVEIQSLQDDAFCFAPEDKWSAGQQLDHIVRSVSPVAMAMGLPSFILQWRFGKANRPSKSFTDLVTKYTNQLKVGGRATGQFIPKNVEVAQKNILIKQLNLQVTKLIKRVLLKSETSLDAYILPHPLLGKLTLREMLYFTIYHVEHHSFLVKKGLEELPQ